MTSSREDISKAADLIRLGKLVAFPTETVYGLGANALDAMAVAKIFSSKERPSFDPLIVHVSDLQMLRKLVSSFDERIEDISINFWPGPLTVVLPKSEIVPDLVTSGLSTVGIRIPNHPVALALINECKLPIAAPSANKFGRTSPTQAAHVLKQLKDVDLVLDGGETTVGIESTIITLHEDGFQILRPGMITKDDLLRILPQSGIDKSDIIAPGMIQSHYSPEKPMYFADDWPKDMDAPIGYISFKDIPQIEFRDLFILSNSGNLEEAAVNLFKAIHHMEDNNDVELILVERVSEEGIGIAIMDRLKKAVHRHYK